MSCKPVLLSPKNGKTLQQISEYLLSDGETLWPLIDGIAYLRENHEVRAEAVQFIKRCEIPSALKILLTDQDEFAPLSPPGLDVLNSLFQSPKPSLREAMRILNFGPVADYFAHRLTSPTYLSGLYLLQNVISQNRPVLEVACGIGYYLRTLEAHGIATIGTDLVFSKLWLARKYLNVQGLLICADVAQNPVILTQEPTTVFCHDAFYFFQDKERVLTNLRQLSAKGNLALGHVHTQHVDKNMKGFPLSLLEYAKMATADACFYDDKTLATAWTDGQSEPAKNRNDLMTAQEISWIEGFMNATQFRLSQPASSLRLNPMLSPTGSSLSIVWPSDGFRKEYESDLGYLLASEALYNADFSMERLSETEIQHLFTQRVLLDLPDQW